jgi:hypothetical protein
MAIILGRLSAAPRLVSRDVGYGLPGQYPEALDAASRVVSRDVGYGLPGQYSEVSDVASIYSSIGQA